MEEEFIDWFDSVSSDNFDEELLDAFLTEMEEVKPLKVSFDSQESLEKFHRRFSPLLKAQCEEIVQEASPRRSSHKPNHLFYRATTVVATVVLVLSTMMTAQALGIDVFGFFTRWTNEIFYFSGTTSQGQEQHPYPLAIGETAEYESLEVALSEFQIDTDLIPSWFPDGVDTLDVTACVTDLGMGIYAISSGDNPYLALSISDFSEESGPDTIIEKDDAKVNSYEVGGHIYYIMNDGKWCKATWIVGNLHFIVRSNVPEEEIKKMIDSIYTVSRRYRS